MVGVRQNVIPNLYLPGLKVKKVYALPIGWVNGKPLYHGVQDLLRYFLLLVPRANKKVLLM